MRQFDYNPNELTTTQLDAINRAKAAYDETIKEINKDEDRLMENYYNCIDDYSWGGLCSQANRLRRYQAEDKLQDEIEMIVRGGYILRTRQVNILRKLGTGELVATKTYQGRYGRFFRTDDGDFVSCSKKVSTYEKKGYTPLIQTITEKVIPDGFWRNGDRRYTVLETVSITEEVSTEICY